MATSTKVRFNLETLRDKAIKSIDFRIAQQRLVVSSFADDEALAARQQEWRVRQEEKITELFNKLCDLDDYALSRFTIDALPTVDKWDRREAQRKLDDLEAKRVQILAKSESLVPDEDGALALTKTQLSEFFGL